jgi:hypothetical protein
MAENVSKRESSTAEEELRRHDFYQILYINVAGVILNLFISLFLAVWYLISVMLHTSFLDSAGVMILPLFSFMCWLLPFAGIWMWIGFFRAGLSRKKVRLPLILSLVEGIWAAAAIYLLGLVLHQVVWGLLS